MVLLERGGGRGIWEGEGVKTDKDKGGTML